MGNSVYVHAYTGDQELIGKLTGFFARINGIAGLTMIEPVFSGKRLDELAIQHPQEFKDLLKQYPFEGLGMWTEWLHPDHINSFWQSELHREFSAYANTHLDRAWYRVVQYLDGEIKTKEIRKPQ